MQLDEEIGSKLLEICLNDKAFDIMLIYERNFMHWYTAMRVLQTALKNEDDIPNESGETAESTSVWLQKAAIVIECNPNNIDLTLLNVYDEQIRPLFKQTEMNIFFVYDMKLRINTTDRHKPLYKVSISFNFGSVSRLQLNPATVIRRLYKSDKFDGPIKECSNKR